MRHTWNEDQRFTRGQPQDGAWIAEDLEEICKTYGGETIAAVFVEPIAGSIGTIVPPVGYLQKLREIADKYGILLVFDEVITGFGRTGTLFGLQYWGIEPDMIQFAKAITSGYFPLGGIGISDKIAEVMNESGTPWMHASELRVIHVRHVRGYSTHAGVCWPLL